MRFADAAVPNNTKRNKIYFIWQLLKTQFFAQRFVENPYFSTTAFCRKRGF
jgi:hypothetical protein